MKKEDKKKKIGNPSNKNKLRDEPLLDPEDFWNDLPNQSNQPIEKPPIDQVESEVVPDLPTKSDFGPTPLEVDQLIPSAKPFRPIAKVYDKPKAKDMITAKPSNSKKRLRIFLGCFLAVIILAIFWMYDRFSINEDAKRALDDNGVKHVRLKDESSDTKPEKSDFSVERPKKKKLILKSDTGKTPLGRLSLISNPAGAIVYINGVRSGVAPTKINTVSVGGKVEIKMELAGYRTWKHEFVYDSKTLEREFVADMFKDIACEFGTGWLHLDSDPTGAIVELDGKRLPGKTPMVVDQVCSAVEHKIRVFTLGYRTWWRSFILNPGEVRTFRASMIK